MEENKRMQGGEFPMPNMGFKIELVNMPNMGHPVPHMDICNFINNNFGKFGLKVVPRQVTKEELVEHLKRQKELLEEKVLRIGEQLKDLEKPLKEGLKKPLKKDVKKKGAKK